MDSPHLKMWYISGEKMERRDLDMAKNNVKEGNTYFPLAEWLTISICEMYQGFLHASMSPT